MEVKLKTIYYVKEDTKELYKSKEFTESQLDEMYINPMFNSKNKESQRYILPRNTTFMQPPESNKNEIAIFKEGAWFVEIDNRGVNYYEQNGEMKTINEIGVALPYGVLTTKRPTEYHDKHNGEQWIYNIKKAKENKKNEIQTEKKKAFLRTISIDNVEVYSKSGAEIKNEVQFDIDSAAQTQYTNFKRKLDSDPNYTKKNWKSNNDTFCKMDMETWKKIDAESEVFMDKLFTWLKDRYKEIEEATTEEDIDKINTKY